MQEQIQTQMQLQILANTNTNSDTNASTNLAKNIQIQKHKCMCKLWKKGQIIAQTCDVHKSEQNFKNNYL